MSVVPVRIESLILLECLMEILLEHLFSHIKTCLKSVFFGYRSDIFREIQIIKTLIR